MAGNFNTETDTIKSNSFLSESHASYSDTKLKDFKIRKAIIHNVYKIPSINLYVIYI